MENANISPHRCRHCQKLVIDLRETKETYEAKARRNPWSKESPAYRATSPEPDIYAAFDFTLEELDDGATKGCPLMKWILDHRTISRCLAQRSNTNLVLQIHTYGTGWDILRIRWFAVWDKATKQTLGQTSSGFGIYTYPSECISTCSLTK